MSIFLLISKSVTFVDLQSLTLCSRKQNASSVVDLKPNQFPALYWPKFSAEFSLNNRCRDYFSWKVLEQLRICYQQLQRILKTDCTRCRISPATAFCRMDSSARDPATAKKNVVWIPPYRKFDQYVGRTANFAVAVAELVCTAIQSALASHDLLDPVLGF